ncbi:MAG: hypothetical protein K2X37_01470 [Chitinophagaceae bacterium]|nr:hypothetical protein [Chitinophagaceae bacterium]
MSNSKASKLKNKGRFNRTKLPFPIVIMCKLNIKTGIPNSSGYWKICCPFHKNGTEKKPSLNIHHVKGNYRCHACGAKGGDALAFFMQCTGTKFVDAAKQLGAWEESL